MVDIMDVIDEGVEEIEKKLCFEMYFVLYMFTFHIWDTHFDNGMVFIVLREGTINTLRGGLCLF